MLDKTPKGQNQGGGLNILNPYKIREILISLENKITAEAITYIAAVLQHYSVPSSEIEQQKAVQKLLEDADKNVRLEIYDQRTISFGIIHPT